MSHFLNPALAQVGIYDPGEHPYAEGSYARLDFNENPYPPSPAVLRCIRETDWTDLRWYPDMDYTPLRRCAAAAWGLEPEQLCVGNGSDELLSFIFQAFGGRGFCFPDLTYDCYQLWAKLFRIPCREIPLREDFTVDVQSYAGMKETVLLANPNAPTALQLPRNELESLLKQDSQRLVIVDEAYADFASYTALSLLDRYDNLLVLRTLSKSYALAGARMGFALGSAELISDLERVHGSANPYNIDRITCRIAEAALADQTYMRDCCDRIRADRQFLRDELIELGFTVTDSAANFLFAGRHPLLAAEEWQDRLKQQRLIVRSFPAPRCAGFLRIAVGTRGECLDVLAATKEILRTKGEQ